MGVITRDYVPLILFKKIITHLLNMPPYHFGKTTHWLDWEEPCEAAINYGAPVLLASEADLITFVGYRIQDKREAEFSVHEPSE